MSRFGKIFLLGLGIAIVFTAASSLLLSKVEIEPLPTPTQINTTMEEQDLSALLATHQSPKIVKCNFTGTYQVEQDIAYARNGAKCDDFETRTLTYNNVIAACSGYLDPNQELFLNCTSTDNPVLKCNGVVYVNVDNTAACEYWVTITRAK